MPVHAPGGTLTSEIYARYPREPALIGIGFVSGQQCALHLYCPPHQFLVRPHKHPGPPLRHRSTHHLVRVAVRINHLTADKVAVRNDRQKQLDPEQIQPTSRDSAATIRPALLPLLPPSIIRVQGRFLCTSTDERHPKDIPHMSCIRCLTRVALAAAVCT